MGLVNRLAGIDDPDNAHKLAVNTFHALLVELANGQVTKADIVSYFSLDADEQTELNWIIAQYNAQPTAAAKEKYVELMRTLFILAESKVSGYTTNAELVARINAI